jgi:metal-responsive CopG/Arc/MetJ family transcriptional regulator
MRTTVSLDDDLAIRLEQLRAERGTSFKDALNDVIRRGLSTLSERQQAGRRLVEDIDSVSNALAIAEGEAFR